MSLKIQLVSFIFFVTNYGCDQKISKSRPNILICIADDVSHMGKGYSWIKTPAFDRVSDEGLIFLNAYTPNAKCAPSRASLLTGRNSWQLKEAANHWNNFPAEFRTFPEALKNLGYYTGYTGKGWGPGNVLGEINGKKRQINGSAWNNRKLEPPTANISTNDYSANFEEFFESKPDEKPFYFWYGGWEAHRKFEYGSSLKMGKKLSDIKEVPKFFPDNKVVRTDILDYAVEVDYFDSHVMKILNFLETKGELENTMVIITSDHGMPFPRAKSDEYDFSNHVPLAIMWGNNIKHPGRAIKNYVSFIDIAPTLFDAAGIKWESSGMQKSPGISLLPFFEGEYKNFRDHVLIGKERHDVGRPNDYGYPIRGIVKDNYLYLRNYRPELWPAANPECGYSTVDGSPTKTEILQLRGDPDNKIFWDLSFGKRPAEELFYLPDDKYCIKNLAASEKFSSKKKNLLLKMEKELKKQEDPRMFGKGDIFHSYYYTWDPYRDLYSRMVNKGEKIVPSWINESDIETDFIEQ